MNNHQRFIAFAFAVTVLWPLSAGAVSPIDPHAQDRIQLRQVFAEIVEGINEQNIDRMVNQMDEHATVIWLNAEASRGHDDIKAYYRRMVGTGESILKKYTTTAQIAAPARFFGDMAVADGDMVDEFVPHRRGPFTLHSNWSVTCVKRGGKWKIVHLHLSANVFNNNLLSEVKRMATFAAAGGLLAGVLFMWALRKFTHDGHGAKHPS